jgi:hypothetical protein
MPPDVECDREDHTLYVKWSTEVKENDFLITVTSELIDSHNNVRTTKGWDGVGSMIGIGKHLNYHGQHITFAVKQRN